MDSTHAELLASEAWRNICDTFLLLVLLLTAAGEGKQGLSRPQWVHAGLPMLGCQIRAVAWICHCDTAGFTEEPIATPVSCFPTLL